MAGRECNCHVHLISRAAKYKHGSLQANYYTLGGSTELLKTFIHRWEKRQTKFPWCRMNSKLYSREKKNKFSTIKSQTEMHFEKHIVWPKQTRLRSEMHWQLFFSLNFRLYFEAAGPDCFNVFCKILLQSKFLGRIISWSPKRVSKNGENIGPWHHDVTNQWWHCDYQPNTINFQL